MVDEKSKDDKYLKICRSKHERATLENFFEQGYNLISKKHKLEKNPEEQNEVKLLKRKLEDSQNKNKDLENKIKELQIAQDN